MDTNIDNAQVKYAGTFKRSCAMGIDVTLVLFLRVFVAQILGVLFFNRIIQNFLLDFQQHFGTEFIKGNAEHMSYIFHHSAFYYILLLYFIIILVGAIYHSYLNSSAWQGTVGKRLLNIVMVNEEGKRIRFSTAMSHYFLSILPFIYVIYIALFQAANQISFFDAITANNNNILFGMVFIVWVQMQAFTKRKTTAYDLICKTSFIEGKTSAKYPWN